MPARWPAIWRVVIGYAFCGNVGDVFLDRCVQVELVLLVQQADRGRCDRLGHAPDAHLRGRPHGLALLEIREAEALGPDDPAVDENGDPKSGRPIRGVDDPCAGRARRVDGALESIGGDCGSGSERVERRLGHRQPQRQECKQQQAPA